MLRKCKVGKDSRPAYFHGWFQFGNSENGMDGMAIVEYENGTTDHFSPGYISFCDSPVAEEKKCHRESCKNFSDGVHSEACYSCKRYYADLCEPKTGVKNG